MAKYALLFAGCYEESLAYPRYANDLGYMYYLLSTVYNYEKTNIKVLYKNGEEIKYIYNNNNINILTDEGSGINLHKQMMYYIRTLNCDDELILMFSNHGGEISEDEATLALWNKQQMLQQNLVRYLKQIKCKKLILFGQCYGGNFLNEKIADSIMITGNIGRLSTYCNESGDYEELFYNFISYLIGCYPNGQAIDSHIKTVQAAYEYAKANDRYKNPIVINSEIRYQVPQIKSNGLDPNTYTL